MLTTGDVAPDFTFRSQDGSIHSLSEYSGLKNVVLFFYPKADTAGCTIEACSFRDHFDEFAGLDAVIIGVSHDQQPELNAFKVKRSLPFFLVSDPGGEIYEKFQVKSFLNFISPRVTFVIGTDGKIAWEFSSMIRFAEHAKGALRFLQSLESA